MLVEPLTGPALDAARDLLASADLPTDDLADPTVTLLGAFDGTAMVGVIGLQTCGHVGLLRSLAVRPDQRGRAIAAELCARVFELANARAMSELYLLTTSAADYFARHGFEAIERTAAPETIRNSAQFAGLCPASATVMRRAGEPR